MQQCLCLLQIYKGSFVSEDFKFVPPYRAFMKFSMESLIHHFKYYSEGFSVLTEESYFAVEAPKGEFGVFVLSDNTNRPSRCRIKSPGFLHLQGLNFMVKNSKLLLADLVTIIGTLDLVFVRLIVNFLFIIYFFSFFILLFYFFYFFAFLI